MQGNSLSNRLRGICDALQMHYKEMQMATLIDRVAVLQLRLGELGQIGIERANFERLKTRAEQMGDQAARFEETTNSLALLRAHEVPLGKLPTASQALRNKVPAIVEMLKKDWVQFANDNSLSTTLITPVAA